MGGSPGLAEGIAENRANRGKGIRRTRGLFYVLLAIRPREEAPVIKATMQKVPLSLNQILERAGRLYPQSQIVSRLPDKPLKRHSFAEVYARARRLAAALLALGLKKGDRVATLSWN